MIDDEVDRHERIDLLRIAAELGHRVAHRGEIDHRGHAGEILHQHPRRAILDLAVELRVACQSTRAWMSSTVTVTAVLEAQQILEQHLHREGQLVDIAELRRGLGEGIIDVGLAADVELERVPSVSWPVAIMMVLRYH